MPPINLFPGMYGAPTAAPVRPATSPSHVGSGFSLANLFGTFTPEEKMKLSGGLGGAALQLSNLLAQRPNASIGESLLAAGAGSLIGKEQAAQGIALGKQQAAEEARAQGAFELQQQEAARKQEEQVRRQQAIAGMPPEMQRVAAWADAGVPSAVIDRMAPKPPDPTQRYKIAGTDVFDMAAEGGPQIVARGSRDAGPLVPIFDPNTGQTVYGTRDQAVGQMAPPKSGGIQITGYDEQGRPLIQMGGPGGEMLSKPTATEIEKEMLSDTAAMQRLQSIESSYKPEYSQILPRAGMEWANLKDKFGQLGQGEQQQLQEFAEWRQNSISNVNRTIKEITGAAMSVPEAERIMKELPDPGTGVFDGDGPTNFKSKLGNAMYKIRLSYARKAYIRARGFPATPDFNGISLDQMPQIIDQRGAEIEKELQAANPNMEMDEINAAVDQQLRSEFGM